MHRHRGPHVTNGHVDVATPEQLLFKLPQQCRTHPRISSNITHRLMKRLRDHRQPPTRVQHAPRPHLNQERVVRPTPERITRSSDSAERKHTTCAHPLWQIEHALSARQVQVSERQSAPTSRHGVQEFAFEQVHRQRVLHERNLPNGPTERITDLNAQEPVERQVGDPDAERHRFRETVHRAICSHTAESGPRNELLGNELHAVPIGRQRAG